MLDEAQDMTPLYCELVCKIINKSSETPSQLCLLGDCYQSIYNFKEADSRFLSGANKIFSNYDKLHVILCIYIVNIFSLSFGGEYLLLGASPRTIAYSFGFLTIYFYIKGNKLYLLFSIVASTLQERKCSRQ